MGDGVWMKWGEVDPPRQILGLEQLDLRLEAEGCEYEVLDGQRSVPKREQWGAHFEDLDGAVIDEPVEVRNFADFRALKSA